MNLGVEKLYGCDPSPSALGGAAMLDDMYDRIEYMARYMMEPNQRYTRAQMMEMYINKWGKQDVIGFAQYLSASLLIVEHIVPDCGGKTIIEYSVHQRVDELAVYYSALTMGMLLESLMGGCVVCL